MGSPGRPLLLIETATSHALVALAGADGTLIAQAGWESGRRHGEELLPRLDRLLDDTGRRVDDLAGVAVGRGPGSFTGLRIGLATAKVIAYTMRLPIVGLPTTRLLAEAAMTEGAAGSVAVVLPAGVGDRYVARYEAGGSAELDELTSPTLVPAVAVAELLQSGDLVAAVDVGDELGESAAQRGRIAQQGLGEAMACAAAIDFAAGKWDDLVTLVPTYVALPRGVGPGAGEMSWSPDLR